MKGGAKVIITGRREEELKKAQAKHPQQIVKYYVGDAGKEADRVKLFEQSTKDYPALNVLINNAGIARWGDQRDEVHQPWAVRQQELDINLSGPIHLTSLFIPHLLKQPQSAVVNVISNLAFVPISSGPVYAASKAGLHAFTLSLRPLLAGSPVRLCAMIPPPVTGTGLGGQGVAFGANVADYCAVAYNDFVAGKLEFAYKESELSRLASRQQNSTAMLAINEMLRLQPFTQ